MVSEDSNTKDEFSIKYNEVKKINETFFKEKNGNLVLKEDNLSSLMDKLDSSLENNIGRYEIYFSNKPSGSYDINYIKSIEKKIISKNSICNFIYIINGNYIVNTKNNTVNINILNVKYQHTYCCFVGFNNNDLIKNIYESKIKESKNIHKEESFKNLYNKFKTKINSIINKNNIKDHDASDLDQIKEKKEKKTYIDKIYIENIEIIYSGLESVEKNTEKSDKDYRNDLLTEFDNNKINYEIFKISEPQLIKE